MKKGISVDVKDILFQMEPKATREILRNFFGWGNVILIPDPVYPVYVDSNIMCGNEIIYMEGNAQNDFLPMPDFSRHSDIIYLCSPNNPTGACYNKEQLQEWVEYALKNQAVILFDAAYEAFISDAEIPGSIYSVEEAKRCAVEFVLCPRLQDLREPGADIPLCRKSWYLKPPMEQIFVLTICGTDVRARNTTGLLISCRKLPLRCLTVRTAGVQRKSGILQKKCPPDRRYADGSGVPFGEESTRRIFGCPAQREWIPGHF